MVSPRPWCHPAHGVTPGCRCLQSYKEEREEESAAAMEKEMVLDPATGEMVTVPGYGGTFT